MSKEKEEKTEKTEVSQRDVLWAKFIENYKAKNPVKAALKEKNGEFKTVPTSFLGKTKTEKGKEVIY